MSHVEIRVRPVVRSVVTRYASDGRGASLETLGEFDNEAYAEIVAEALRDRNAPRQYALIQRTFEPGAKVFYAEHEGVATVMKDELEREHGCEFQIFERLMTDPVAVARINAERASSIEQQAKGIPVNEG